MARHHGWMSDGPVAGGPHPHVEVTVVLGVCSPEARRVARAFPAETRVGTTAETESGLLAVLQEVTTGSASPDRIVVQCSSGVLPHDVMALFAAHGGPLPTRAVLAAIVAVIDAEHLLVHLMARQAIARHWSGEDRSQPLAVVAVDQVEHSDAVVVTNWRRSSRDDLGRILALLAHLNPDARLSMFRAGRSWVRQMSELRSFGRRAPGWVRLLNDEFTPHVLGFGLTAFRYEQSRPFHPERLLLLLESGFERLYGTLVRSVGLCRIATRPGVTGKWEQAGPVISFFPLAADRGDDPLAIGQEIAFIGFDLDEAALAAALDVCALTDAEFAAGPAAWTRYADPLPSWEGALPDAGHRS